MKFSNKIFSYLSDNILFLETLFLLIFIPLFPKIPVLDVKNTWVYIRGEDFVVLFILLSWLVLLLRKKFTLRTPLTLPIFTFWIIGGIATIHGVLLIFPMIANVFPNVAFLSFARHIEYMSLFFIAYHGIRDKKQLPAVIATLTITLIAVVAYGFGQKYLGLPAYLTMNEEFAKGIPIRLSELSRVPSTFGGHYDLAAYLVLIIPIMASLFFGVRNWIVKIILVASSLLGLALLFMTVSRVSFLTLFISLFIVLFFQKKKLVFVLIPLMVLFVFLLLSFQPSLSNRFKSTVSEAEVLVDTQTGESIGNVKFKPHEFFKDKIVLQRKVRDKGELAKALAGVDDNQQYSSASAILPYKFIPQVVPLVTAVNISTGENLPQGTGYINLYLSPVIKRVSDFYYVLPPDSKGFSSAQILVIHGDFIIKKASAYDLSFTTRFQGEWPSALEAFKRNIMLGSGYGSVSLAVDNNYLRILGENGLLGFLSLFIIFLSLAIYIKKIYPDIDSKLAKSFVLGFAAGVVGIALNATLIDVFEASKVAFLFWILVGITFKILSLYQKHEFNLLSQIKKVVISPLAIIIYLFLLTIVLYSPMLGNYFVGDDFTWLRWATDCSQHCSPISIITRYFTDAGGFFYRPGTKTYFYLIYHAFWLNQVIYHFISLILHFMVASLFYLLAKRILRRNLLAVSAAIFFLIMSGYQESVFWISSTGYLFNAIFGLLGLLSFILWEEKRKFYYLIASFISISLALLFHELGVVFPLLIVAYKLKDGRLIDVKRLFTRVDYLVLYIPVVSYLLLRFAAKSHWFNGDYSYDIIKLPFNFVGNILGYLLIAVVGPITLPIYTFLRNVTRENILLSLVLIVVAIPLAFLAHKIFRKYISPQEKRVIIFGSSFFIIALLPFLGLGNITSRYSYLATLGIVFVLVIALKRIYEHLLSFGKDIAVSGLAIFVIVFSLFHVISIQQTYSDWHGAGEKSRKFFISLDSFYADSWGSSSVQFHLVDVPLKVGQAWVFPVGLDDAVWFAFRNKSTRIFKHSNVASAIEQAGLSPTNYILKFNEDGTVTQIDHPRKAPFNLIMHK